MDARDDPARDVQTLPHVRRSLKILSAHTSR
jgi:hypothetical protein